MISWIATMLCVASPGDEPRPLPAAVARAVDFDRDVRPILRARCVKCHGETSREGDFRLDVKDDAMEGGLSGPAIVVGKSAESRLVRLIAGRGDGPAKLMPPAGKGERLSDDQVALIRGWIDQGAKWSAAADAKETPKHWAYVPPLRRDPPKVKNPEWVRNPIDAFVLAKLEAEGLRPSPEAEKTALIRRVSLDLTGLPPTADEVEAFLNDNRADAYQKLVDRLLASPHYGERWGRMWLDLARYADTDGYEKDPIRTMWPYRDWVIAAFNRDLPFDRFTIDQIAGDLVPGASIDQKVASGFHRNTMSNSEGGVDPEEARVATIVDRVNTTATVWLGSTLACAQCHTHKYDPFGQKEYYSVFAIFNNCDEPEVEFGSADEIARRDALRSARAALEAELKTYRKTEPDRLKAWRSAQPAEAQAKLDANAALKAFRLQDAGEIQRKQAIDDLKKREPGFITAKVLSERAQPRVTKLMVRGNFLNPGEVVAPGVPAVFPPLPKGTPANRLTFARWLVDPAHPLTARVFVNRVWEAYFGRGIVGTLEDFGTQGDRPTHPELLDWLATDFVSSGWSVKALHRRIATSAVYRQSSRVSPMLRDRDPENRLLARGPRFRVEAETVRDVALTASGLLSRKVGGPSVFPPQPEGIWTMIYSSDRWVTSPGDDRFRRGMYTFWRRTAPYPTFSAFDAPSREACTARRSRTNTPIQALTTLNDPAFIEAASALAARMIAEGGGDPSRAIDRGYLRVVSRHPHPAETARILALYRGELDRYKADKPAAVALAGSNPAKLDPADLAAMTVVANVLLNLDEAITKE